MRVGNSNFIEGFFRDLAWLVILVLSLKLIKFIVVHIQANFLIAKLIMQVIISRK